MMPAVKHKHLITFGSVMVVAWMVGTFLFIYFWPHLVTNHFKRAIVDQGFGDGPVPINTLYTEPQKLFGDPLHTSLPPGSSNLMSVGVNHDTLLTVGWLDLNKGPQVLHVPDFSGRYYSVQFTGRLTLTSPMSARAPRVRKRATTSLRGRTGKNRYRAA
jgi:hypothetical protein